MAASEFGDWVLMVLLLHVLHWGQRALFFRVGATQIIAVSDQMYTLPWVWLQVEVLRDVQHADIRILPLHRIPLMS
jgi:hypothetical protein